MFGFGKARIHKLRRCIRAVWVASAKLGFCEPPYIPYEKSGPPRWWGSIKSRKVKDPKITTPLCTRLPAPEPGTVRHFAYEVYIPEHCITCTQEHIDQIHYTFSLMHEFFGRDLLIEEQTDALAAKFLRWIKEQGRAHCTINKHRGLWFSVWKYAAEQYLIDRYPRLRKLKVILDTPDAWSAEEVRRIIDTAGQLQGLVGDIPAAHFWQALLLTIRWAAVRRGTIVRLRRADMNLVTGVLSVPGRSMKNRRGQKFALGPDAVEAIKRIWLPERDLLFPWPLGRDQLGDHLIRIINAAGVARGERKGFNLFHKLRRSTATEAAIHGGMTAAMELLGHSTVAMTERYVDPSMLPSKDTTRFLAPLGVTLANETTNLMGDSDDSRS